MTVHTLYKYAIPFFIDQNSAFHGVAVTELISTLSNSLTTNF